MMCVQNASLAIVLLMLCLAQTGTARKCFNCEDYAPIGHGVNVGNLTSLPECSRASVIDRQLLQVEECLPEETCVAIRGEMTVIVPMPHGRHWVSYEAVVRGCWKKQFEGCADDKLNHIHALAVLSSRIGYPVAKFYGDVCYCDYDYCSAVSCSDGTAGFFGYCVDWWLLVCITLTILLLTCSILFLACYFGCKKQKKPQTEAVWSTESSGHDNPSYPNMKSKRPSIQPFIKEDECEKK